MLMRYGGDLNRLLLHSSNAMKTLLHSVINLSNLSTDCQELKKGGEWIAAICNAINLQQLSGSRREKTVASSRMAVTRTNENVARETGD